MSFHDSDDEEVVKNIITLKKEKYLENKFKNTVELLTNGNLTTGILITHSLEDNVFMGAGCGKTTLSRLIEKEVEKEGGSCYIFNIDVYRFGGQNEEQIYKNVEETMKEIQKDKNKYIVIIIDDNFVNDISNWYGYDLSKWTNICCMPNFDKTLFDELIEHKDFRELNTMMSQFLAWSFNNICERNNKETDSFLNPVLTKEGDYSMIPVGFSKDKKQPFDLCKIVHLTSMTPLLKYYRQSIVYPCLTFQFKDAIETLRIRTRKYQKYLDETYPLSLQVKNIMEQIKVYL